MKHAFIMNCHGDFEQALLSTGLLEKHWLAHSALYLYLDGKDYPQDVLDRLSARARIIRAPYEPNKCQSIMNAMNSLMEQAGRDQITVVSFLHPDIIPIFPQTFYAFITRFLKSGKTLSFTPFNPFSKVVDFCNLHFNVSKALECKLFPVSRDPALIGTDKDYNEYQVSQSFTKNQPRWIEEAYTTWMISQPRWLIDAVSWSGSVIMRNYTPETSVVHCNDPHFWEHYEQLGPFKERVYPVGISPLR